MAWVRRVRTSTGATAVQVVRSVKGKREIVAHVGSAHDEAELGVLMDQARAVLASVQAELDLGVVMPVVKAELLGEASPGLFVEKAKTTRKTLVAPSGVLKTFSELLFDVIGGIYDELGFSEVNDRWFKDLVIAQIVEPTSLLDVDRVLQELGRQTASFKTRQRTLRRCVDGAYRDQIASACFDHASTRGDVSLVLFDVTTLRTATEKEDDFRKVGYSKDRSVDPQVVVALLVDRQGFPLEIAGFQGNMSEKLTLLPVVDQFKTRHGIKDMVIAADAGMLSATNLKALDDAGYRFIVGSRATKAPIDLESHFAWHGEFIQDGQIVDTLTPKIGRNSDNDTGQVGEPIWDPVTYPGSWRAIWAYSTKRFVHDNRMLDLQQARAQAVIDGAMAAHKPRFVQKAGGVWRLDQASLTRARRVAGLKGYAVVTVMLILAGMRRVYACQSWDHA